MKQLVFSVRVLVVLVFTLAFASLAQGQATRTWVSGVGDDVNPCSGTAPCKTFAGAISKTAAGGEIDALDPGGYGAVTITKAITIDGGGFASVLVSSGTNAIVVNAGGLDQITLRNLSITGVGTGLTGVDFVNGLALHVKNCQIDGFTNFGIHFRPGATAFLFVSDTRVSRAAAGGIFVDGSSSFPRATITRV